MPKEPYNGYELPDILTGHALRQVCFDIPDVAEYRRAFWGKVFELTEFWRWEKTTYGDYRNKTAAEYWEQILYANLNRFLANDTCDPQDDECRSYPPSAPFIQWFPNDPYYSPDLVGEGYNNPAWYLATTASNIAYGSSPGDVITSLDRFPPGSLPDILPASGLPRFRINVTGAGTVKAKLVNLFGGSLIQTTVDDDIGTIKFIDVSKDTISLPPETQTEITVEFEVTGEGHHHIDFIVVSWANSSIPFLHHGGGLREVELCGFITMPVTSPPFRFTEECGLEYYNGEEWIPVEGWGEFAPICFKGDPGEDGEDGDDSPATIVQSNPAGFGNMQQNIAAAGFADIANSDFLRRDGAYPMVGGLEIEGATDEIKLAIKGVGSPYQTNKLVVFKNASNVEVAWVNPRGDAVFSGDAAGARALNLVGGGIGIDHNKYMYWKDSAGTIRLAFGVGSNQMFYRGGTAGIRWDDSGGNVQMLMDAANLIRVWNQVPTTGVTQFRIKSGAGQGSSALLTLEQNNANSTLTVNDTGQIIARRRDQSSGAAADVLQLDNRAAVPGLTDLGVNLRLTATSSTTSARDQMLIRTGWDSATDATRKAHFSLIAADTAEREVLRGGANGSSPTIGVLGAPDSPRVDVGTIDCAGNVGAKAALEALKNFGWIQGTINLGTVPEPPPPDPVDPALERCARARRTVHLLYERYLVASDIAVNQATFYDYTLELVYRFGMYFTEPVQLIDWADVTIIPAIEPGELAAHQMAIADALTEIGDFLYCYLDNENCMTAVNYDLFRLAIGEINSDVEIFAAFLAAFRPEGFGMMMSEAWFAYCDDGSDCSEVDCDNWTVDMNFMLDDWDNSIELDSGEYEPPYENEAPARCDVAISCSAHATSVSATVNVTYPTDINFHDTGGAVFDLRPVSIGTHTFTFEYDCPSGFEIVLGSTPCEDGVHYTAQIRRLIVTGVGAEPTP